MENFNDMYNKIIYDIKIIDNQINELEGRKIFFFQKNKLQKYNEKIEKLECVKRYLYKKLEYMIEND